MTAWLVCLSLNWLVQVRVLVGTLCCVLVWARQFTLSVSLHLVNLMLGITTVASHPGERRILLVASCYTYHDELAWRLKDVCAHCYCVTLVRTPSIRHACATSFSSPCTKSKTQQNIELMTFALAWWANIFVGCSVTPTFFRQITSFCDSFHYTKKQKKSVCGKF